MGQRRCGYAEPLWHEERDVRGVDAFMVRAGSRTGTTCGWAPIASMSRVMAAVRDRLAVAFKVESHNHPSAFAGHLPRSYRKNRKLAWRDLARRA